MNMRIHGIQFEVYDRCNIQLGCPELAWQPHGAEQSCSLQYSCSPSAGKLPQPLQQAELICYIFRECVKKEQVDSTNNWPRDGQRVEDAVLAVVSNSTV